MSDTAEFNRVLEGFLLENRLFVELHAGPTLHSVVTRASSRWNVQLCRSGGTDMFEPEVVAEAGGESIAEAIAAAVEVYEAKQNLGTPPHRRISRKLGYEENARDADLEPNRKWTTAYKNQLPDSAFLYVRKDCVEYTDERGRSHPLDCRELPVKNQQGHYDKTHVLNAISRSVQMKGVPEAEMRRLQKKAKVIYAREFGGYASGYVENGQRSYSYGKTPDEVIRAAAHEQTPDGYPMHIKSQEEWDAIAEAWNQGIDSRLEALSERSSADPSTGRVLVHPDELHVLLRRLGESENEEANLLRGDILQTLEIEEI